MTPRANRPLRILALAAYPERIASTRFRVSTFIPELARHGIEMELVSWLDDDTAKVLYRAGYRAERARGAALGLLRELRAVFERGWDGVFVQREATLAGPPIVEALGYRLELPLIFDFDDAIWIARGGLARRLAKCAWKVDWTLSRAAHAIAGSDRLAAHSRALGAPTTVIRTVVDHRIWSPPEHRFSGAWGRESDADEPLSIGWIGSHATASQLVLAAPALRRLRAEGHRFRVRVVGAGSDFRLDGLEVDYADWSLEREVRDFRDLDIGLAPMLSGGYYDGKCGFKQIQYMAVGTPFVTSNGAGASEFVQHDVQGLVAETDEQWYLHLRALLTDAALRARLGRGGRELVENELSLQVQAPRLAEIFRRYARPRVAKGWSIRGWGTRMDASPSAEEMR